MNGLQHVLAFSFHFLTKFVLVDHYNACLSLGLSLQGSIQLGSLDGLQVRVSTNEFLVDVDVGNGTLTVLGLEVSLNVRAIISLVESVLLSTSQNNGPRYRA